MNEKNENGLNSLLKKATYGGVSGFIAGIIVAIPEAGKVYKQINPSKKMKFNRELAQTLVKVVPSFATSFAGACAIEFSINDEINKKYGWGAGIFASSVSGSAFLTPADYVILRSHTKNESTAKSMIHFKEVGLKYAFTGIMPMFIREVCFTSSVMLLGPAVARKIYNTEDPDIKQLSVGRLIAGVPTSIVSHPFDTAKTMLQMMNEESLKNPNNQSVQRPITAVYNTFKNNPKMMLSGAAWRIPLAAGGGALAGAIYNGLEKAFKDDGHANISLKNK